MSRASSIVTTLGLIAATLGFAPGAGATSVNGSIAFRSNRDGNNEIYVMNADGSGQSRLTNNAANDFDPAFSPDGTKIAFASSIRNSGPDAKIYVMNADGTDPTNLTTAADDRDPAFSPDGRKIAFTRGLFGSNADIYVMNADGSGQTRLTNVRANDTSPAFSPDGTKIAFSSLRGPGGSEIYLMNADGSGQTRLTNNPATRDTNPVFSPDGLKIAFVSERRDLRDERRRVGTDQPHEQLRQGHPPRLLTRRHEDRLQEQPGRQQRDLCDEP